MRTLFLLSTALLVLPAYTSVAEDGDTAEFDEAMKPALTAYLEIHAALAADSVKGVRAAAKRVLAATTNLEKAKVTGEHASHYESLPAKIAKAAKALAKAMKLEDTRETFKKLSRPMAMWGTMSKPAGIDVVFCSMAKGSWLQRVGEVRNPYHGEKMLSCGEVVGGARHAHGIESGTSEPDQ